MVDYTSLLKLAITASIEAGEEILKIYETNFEVEIKKDSTPVTQADKAASDSIIKHLGPSKINVLSEEGFIFDFESRNVLMRDQNTTNESRALAVPYVSRFD